MDVYPGDKIVIHKAVLWLGAAAVFYLPLLIIPLRSVENQRAPRALVPGSRIRFVRGRLDQDPDPVRQRSVLLRLLHRQLFHEARARASATSASTRARKAGAASASTSTRSTTSPAGGRQTNLALQEQENFSQHLREQLSIRVSIQLRSADQHSAQRDDQRSHRAPNRANVAELQLQPQLRRRTIAAATASRSPTRASSTKT